MCCHVPGCLPAAVATPNNIPIFAGGLCPNEGSAPWPWLFLEPLAEVLKSWTWVMVGGASGEWRSDWRAVISLRKCAWQRRVNVVAGFVPADGAKKQAPKGFSQPKAKQQKQGGGGEVQEVQVQVEAEVQVGVKLALYFSAFAKTMRHHIYLLKACSNQYLHMLNFCITWH